MQTPFHRSPWAYDAAGQDYLIWQVINPSTFLMPMFIALTILAIAVHTVAFSIPGRAWTNHKAAPVAVEAPAVAATPAG
ncbi:light-harvesting antenna LH1, alpha subunit [uncultured Thiodictyon sp.]|uniref:light-harvesting antenna LH1, alpha subunit n=1 Tax=uncultured Thiodictyon sp. TaxID=1846217 RepID=UPI0025D90664|nr:light-harvesting antenna LH1, alpha subunit [uncultured Thiodictyon sp.]